MLYTCKGIFDCRVNIFGGNSQTCQANKTLFGVAGEFVEGKKVCNSVPMVRCAYVGMYVELY